MPADEPDTEPGLPQAVEAAPPDGPAPATVRGKRRGLRVPLGRRGWTITVAGVVAAALASYTAQATAPVTANAGKSRVHPGQS